MPPQKLRSNPAQRLYDLLEKHTLVLPEAGASGLFAVWSDVLGVPTEDLLPEFTLAFSLIAQIDQALKVTGDAVQRRTYQVHVHAWRRAFLPETSGAAQVVKDGEVPEAARLALGGIASHLRDNIPEGVIPDEDLAASLRDEVASAIEAVMDDESLPLLVQDLLLRRLHDILWAADHVAMLGAGGVAAACDRLAVAILWTSNQKTFKDKSVLKRMSDIVVHGYAVVGVADTVGGGYQAWSAIEPYLTEGLKLIAP